MNHAAEIAQTANVDQTTVLHAARGVAEKLVESAGGLEQAIELLQGEDAGEVAAAMFQDYAKGQRAAANKALTHSDDFARAVAGLAK